MGSLRDTDDGGDGAWKQYLDAMPLVVGIEGALLPSRMNLLSSQDFSVHLGAH